MKRRNFIRNISQAGCILWGGEHLGLPLSESVDTWEAGVGDDALLMAKLKDRSKPLKWIFCGDSITAGVKHTYGWRSYPQVFEERIRFEIGRSRDLVINTAISGHTTIEICNDIDWRMLQFKPDVVSLMIGTNDCAMVRNMKPQEFGENLKTLLKRIRKCGAIPIFQTPNTIDFETEAGRSRTSLPLFVEEMRTLALSEKIILVDHWKFWQSHQQSELLQQWRADPLHPSGKGHLELARLLFHKLNIFDENAFTCAGVVPC